MIESIKEKVKLYFSDKEHRIGELLLDAIIKESHELKAEISEHPTEKGDSFVDHIALAPSVIQIEGIISNTPMTWLGITAFKSFDNYLHDRSNDMAEQAFTKLEEIFNQRLPITITTSLKAYEHMVLESLCVERGGGNSESINRRRSKISYSAAS